MKTVASVALAVLVSVVLCAGCSVKEDRSLCPCRLVLDFSGVDTNVVRSVDLALRADGGFAHDDRLHTEDFRNGVSVAVPSGFLSIGLSAGTEGRMTDKGLAIPFGEDCPPVYFHSSTVEMDGEEVLEKVRMRKNHCLMTINLNNTESDPKGIRVIGNVGAYLPDGSPAEGGFSYDIPLRGSVGNKVVLPRQVDDSLVMDVSDGMGILRRFPIGVYISESGYDWNEADLKDLTLDIDIAVTAVTLVIEGGDVVYKFDVTI